MTGGWGTKRSVSRTRGQPGHRTKEKHSGRKSGGKECVKVWKWDIMALEKTPSHLVWNTLRLCTEGWWGGGRLLPEILKKTVKDQSRSPLWCSEFGLYPKGNVNWEPLVQVERPKNQLDLSCVCVYGGGDGWSINSTWKLPACGEKWKGVDDICREWTVKEKASRGQRTNWLLSAYTTNLISNNHKGNPKSSEAFTNAPPQAVSNTFEKALTLCTTYSFIPCLPWSSHNWVLYTTGTFLWSYLFNKFVRFLESNNLLFIEPMPWNLNVWWPQPLMTGKTYLIYVPHKVLHTRFYFYYLMMCGLLLLLEGGNCVQVCR